MALFGRDYDDTYRSAGWNDRGNWNRSDRPMHPNRDDYYGNQAMRSRGWTGQDRFDTNRYARDYETLQGTRRDRGFDGYDQGYKSRWQTDYGDPFGDRQQHTPMRVIRGDAHGYDRTFRSGGYDRNFQSSPYPFGYQPYDTRAGYDAGYRNSGYRTSGYRNFDRGYDRGWF